ncbi:hypothetical protein F8154_02845 [Alkaliphilus pronyensis]|uniref:Helix-hairpin-helix DNA-binding motif class 1 domain-containing protein n=1 Tax=Alkaliphilus pronyensis TaxID=1482732 RepID=A0A6I0FDV2_9FIRM|nr:helix-hairpin-helix domain-containing protein [Alkaliphilus pronyensis]KAB3537249.1 hypothetical protein F8154_02845 [Alkaliphilus pronyensis]
MILRIKQKRLLIVILSILILSLIFVNVIGKKRVKYVVSPKSESESIEENQQNTQLNNNGMIKILVHVDGAVEKPGVYEFTGVARVIDAINKAGGLKEEADTSKINLALKIKDEDFIYVPKLGEEVAISNNNQSLVSNKLNNYDKININTANLSELASLNGIGEALAQRIIDYRNIHGPFSNIDDIKRVKGIGDKKFEAIKNDIIF